MSYSGVESDEAGPRLFSASHALAGMVGGFAAAAMVFRTLFEFTPWCLLWVAGWCGVMLVVTKLVGVSAFKFERQTPQDRVRSGSLALGSAVGAALACRVGLSGSGLAGALGYAISQVLIGVPLLLSARWGVVRPRRKP